MSALDILASIEGVNVRGGILNATLGVTELIQDKNKSSTVGGPAIHRSLSPERGMLRNNYGPNNTKKQPIHNIYITRKGLNYLLFNNRYTCVLRRTLLHCMLYLIHFDTTDGN